MITRGAEQAAGECQASTSRARAVRWERVSFGDPRVTAHAKRSTAIATFKMNWDTSPQGLQLMARVP
jgi:hypothetical protein